METFAELKDLVPNTNFEKQRSKALKKINYKHIDNPIVDIIKQLNELSYFFTLQCCYGHFLYKDQKNEHNLEPIPKLTEIEEIEYRIAYLAFCIQDSEKGRDLLNKLKGLTKIDSHNIQFGCADWFWERQVNSFVLQVEPDRYKMYDKANLEYKEALLIESVRNQFFNELNALITDKI
jgi:hypothetical protein